MAENATIAILLSLLFIFALILIVVAVWIIRGTNQEVTVTPNTASPSGSTDGTVGLSYQCIDYNCGEGLECDPNLGVCRLSEGEPCTVGYQCVSGTYCSGTCTTTEPGYISGLVDAPCPCDPTMTCLGGNTCKIRQDFACQEDEQCASGVCVSGFCSGGKPNGEPCTQDIQCTFNNCSEGTCQAEGVTTGLDGAVCSVGNPCFSNVNCIIEDGETFGTCMKVNNGLGLSCSVDDDCTAPLVCGGLGVCEMSSPDSNVCTAIGDCPVFLTCVSGKCIDTQSGKIPALFPSNCVSNSTEEGNYLANIGFNTSTSTSYNTQDIVGSTGAIYTGISVFGPLPSGISKIINFGNSPMVVIPGNGIYNVNSAVYRDTRLVDATGIDNSTMLVVLGDSSVGTTILMKVGLINLASETSPPVKAPGTNGNNQVIVDGSPIMISRIEMIQGQDYGGIQSESGLYYYYDKDSDSYKKLVDPFTGVTYGQLDSPAPYFYNGGSHQKTNVSYIDSNGRIQFIGDAESLEYPLLSDQNYTVLSYSISNGTNSPGSMPATALIQRGTDIYLVAGSVSSSFQIQGYMSSRNLLRSMVDTSVILVNDICSSP